MKRSFSVKQYLRQSARRLPAALACSAVLPFTLFLFVPMDMYAANKTEFLFTFGDIGGWLLFLSVAATMASALLLALLPRRISAVLCAILLWLGGMSVMQGMFLNIGMKSLLGDGGGSDTPLWLYILDTALWVITGVAAVLAALFAERMTWVRTVAGVLVLVLLGMQTVGSVSILGTVFSDEDNGSVSYLSTEGLYEVAPGKNTVVFILDRFDYDYYMAVKEKQSDFFDPLTGFTLFGDNISLYSRTYPAIGSMITGLAQEDETGTPFSEDADTYFARAYSTSPFLQDMQDNGYSIRLYTGPYYGYRDAAPLAGIAENVEEAEGHHIFNMHDLVKDMIMLSFYRISPQVLKGTVMVTTAMFNSLVQYDGDNPAYAMDDAAVFRDLAEGGLTVSQEGAENGFRFIHLNGCHSPHHLSKEGTYTRQGTVEDATMGCFRLIYRYIDELKRLGLYEDATILITGDHPWGRTNAKEPAEPRLTPVFVKPAGTSDDPLRVSSAQVSQENNMQAFLVKSSDLQTEHNYGISYLDVPEDQNVIRHHIITLNKQGSYRILRYTINGSGNDFANWEKTDSIPIGYLYR